MFRIALKSGLLLLFLLLAHWSLPALLQDQQRLSGGPFWFAFIWLTGLAATVAVAFSRQIAVRVFWAVLMSYAAGNALSYLYITGAPLNAIEVERLFQDIAFLDETIEFYGPLIGKAILVMLLLTVAILLPAPVLPLRWSRWARRGAWLPLLPVSAIAGVVYFDGGGDSDGFPQHLNPIGFVAVLLGDEWLKPDPGPRQSVAVKPTRSELDKIVVIMDESVRGDWLDINSANGIPTGLIGHSHHAANFGLTASHANCSAASNLSFRYATRRDSFQLDAKTRPSLWSYAKAAGYRAVYLDGQRTNRELQNFMTAQELAEIDELIQHHDSVVARDKDMVLVESLRELLARPERLFVYVNKNGVHFPYEGKYPPEAALFRPHMETGTIKGLNEGNQYGDGFGNEAFRNSYKNAVAWNTGEFFNRLLPGLDLQRTLIVYTSDHGQNFTKTQEVGFLTHCTTGPAPAAEGTVPLVWLTEHPATLHALQQSAQRWQHQTSHWNVPSTVLQLMGYPTDWLAENYEPTLFADALGKPQFVSTYFVRFGLQPVWNDPVQPKLAE
ncbi:MAG: sulfatase-like hydrolase/transferase [Permianibacter sp.]